MKNVNKNQKKSKENSSSTSTTSQASRKNVDQLDNTYREKNLDKGSNMGNYLQEKWFRKNTK